MKPEAEGSGKDAHRAEDAAPVAEAPERLRMDRIEHARRLLQDPGYPGIEVARALSRIIVESAK